MKRTDILPAAIIALIIALIALTYFAHPAYAQEQRCTVQSFNPPIGPTFAMPGDADTIRITLADGTGITVVGPFTLGQMIDAGGLIVGLEKCVGSIPAPEPTPEPEPTPTVPAPDPTPIPEPTPTPEDQCCTTIVTPGPEPTPTVVVPAPPTPPIERPPHTPTGQLITQTPTPATPGRPTLPETGSNTGPLVVAALTAIGAGLMALNAARRS